LCKNKDLSCHLSGRSGNMVIGIEHKVIMLPKEVGWQARQISRHEYSGASES
jgi:hypothetical protein